jgi:hypothetical protein
MERKTQVDEALAELNDTLDTPGVGGLFHPTTSL